MQQVTKATIRGYLHLIVNFEEINPISQNEKDSSYFGKRRPEDGKIVWNQNSRSVFNLCRALYYPYPMAFFSWNERTIKIRRAKVFEDSTTKYEKLEPGTVVDILEEGVVVLCGEGALIITELEAETGLVAAAKLLPKTGILLR